MSSTSMSAPTHTHTQEGKRLQLATGLVVFIALCVLNTTLQGFFLSQGRAYHLFSLRLQILRYPYHANWKAKRKTSTNSAHVSCCGTYPPTQHTGRERTTPSHGASCLCCALRPQDYAARVLAVSGEGVFTCSQLVLHTSLRVCPTHITLTGRERRMHALTLPAFPVPYARTHRKGRGYT